MIKYQEYCNYIRDREIKSCTEYNNIKRLKEIKENDIYVIKSGINVDDQKKIYDFMIESGIPYTDIEFSSYEWNEIYYALHINKIDCPIWFKNKYPMSSEPSFIFLEGDFLSKTKNRDGITKEKWFSEIVNCMRFIKPNDHDGYHVRKFDGMMWSINDPKKNILQELFKYADSIEIHPCVVDTLLRYVTLSNDKQDDIFITNIKYNEFEKMKKVIRFQLFDYGRAKNSEIYYKFHRYDSNPIESKDDNEIVYKV
jgi:hypothetical protein